MVVLQQRREMARFVTALVETARRYDIREQTDDHVLVAQKPEFARNPEHPVQVYVALLAGNMTLAEYNRLIGKNTEQGVYTATVFYKDGETAMVRLGARGHIKGNGRSLKKYRKEDIDKMVHLRGLEARVLELEKPADTLVYYQPETARLAEAVRGYQMRMVTLDSSHLKPGDRGYGRRQETQIADDYRLPEEVYRLLPSDSIMFKDTESGRRILNIVPAVSAPAPAAVVAPVGEQAQYGRLEKSSGVQLSLFRK